MADNCEATFCVVLTHKRQLPLRVKGNTFIFELKFMHCLSAWRAIPNYRRRRELRLSPLRESVPVSRAMRHHPSVIFPAAQSTDFETFHRTTDGGPAVEAVSSVLCGYLTTALYCKKAEFSGR